MALIHRIDAVQTAPIRQINNDHTGPMREFTELRAELNGRLDRLNDKIDRLYRWIIGTFVAAGVSAIVSILDGFF
jgi:flagellin-specific chaperone FliS